MKTLLMLVMAVSTLMAQDIAGNYRVSALDVQYYDIARQDVDVKVQDAYGLGVELTLTTIHAGDLFYGTHSGPYNEAALAFAGINLNVNFNEDGSASLAAGSYYPDVNEENCVSAVQVLPITDDMVYSSDLTALSPLPSTNMIGLPSISSRAGDYAGGLSLNEALVFDYFPQGAAGYINQLGADFIPDYCVGIDADEGCTGANQSNGLAPVSLPLTINETYNDTTGLVEYPGWDAGKELPGIHGGWVSVGDLGDSGIPTSTVSPDLYAEWHAIDGPASESGLGDFIGQDEDGFDGDLDRTFGLPVLPTATYFVDDGGTGACSLYGSLGNTPVAGDVTESLEAGVTGQCYGTVLAGIEGGCYDTVTAGIAAQCGVYGIPAMVEGSCVEQVNSAETAATCEAVGVYTTLYGFCTSLGADAITCDAIAAGLDYTSGSDCTIAIAIAGATEMADGSATLCQTAGGIADGMFASDCSAFAGSFSEDSLNGLALELNGATCPDTAAYYAGMYAAGDAGATAELDAMAAGVVGMSCPDYGAAFVAGCVSGIDVATSMYVMDPSGNSAPWSNFVTWNGVAASQAMVACLGLGLDAATCASGGGGAICTDAGYPMSTCGPLYAIPTLMSTDDSGSEMDPSCLADGDFSDCSGRVRFNFAPTCIPEIEVRQVVIEAVLLGDDGCAHNGDANESGGLEPVNVLDVVMMVGFILGNNDEITEGSTGFCNADINSDGLLNILDVVAVVQVILNGRTDSASAVEIIKSSEGVSFVADGSVGGIQMTISHGDDFSIEMTDKAMVADYRTEGNSTILMVVNPESNELFVAEGNYTIETVVAAANGEYIDISVPSAFSVSNAYPNPFNPTTSLNINLDAASYVSVKVFNVMGQLIDTVTEGQMTVGTHAINWDASSVASGVYFINTEVGTSLSSQKVMLLK